MRKLSFLFTFIFCITLSSFAISLPDVTISLYNQKVYTTDSEIELQVKIRNAQIQPITLKLANNRVHNVQLDVRTMSNDRIQEQDQCIKEFTSSQPIYYSEYKLKPNEEFSFIIKLSDFIDIKQTGKYKVTLVFYKDFRGEPDNSVRSNTLDFEIFSMATEKPKAIVIEKEVSNIIDPNLKSPDEIVLWTMEALEKEDWNNFFFYLDLEALFLRSGNNRMQYQRLSETERINKIEQYKEWLSKGEKDKDLLLVPESFHIIKTSFNETDAEVIVNKNFIGNSFTEEKQYTYFLKKNNSSWKIVDYEITNILRTQK